MFRVVNDRCACFRIERWLLGSSMMGLLVAVFVPLFAYLNICRSWQCQAFVSFSVLHGEGRISSATHRIQNTKVAGGRATALQANRPEHAASVDSSAGAAAHRGRTIRQGHRLDQAAQGGQVDHIGVPATVPRRGLAVRCRGIATWKGRPSHSP